MARKAYIAVLVYEPSVTNLSPLKKVVSNVFEQLQNDYWFSNYNLLTRCKGRTLKY